MPWVLPRHEWSIRVFTLYTGGNEGLAFLLEPEVPAAMARSGLFSPHEVPERPSLDDRPQ